VRATPVALTPTPTRSTIVLSEVSRMKRPPKVVFWQAIYAYSPAAVSTIEMPTGRHSCVRKTLVTVGGWTVVLIAETESEAKFVT
jgi:hypothetical protein